MAVPEEVMGETVTVIGGGGAAVVVVMARVVTAVSVVKADSVVAGRLGIVTVIGGSQSTRVVHKYYKLVKKLVVDDDTHHLYSPMFTKIVTISPSALGTSQ